VDKVADNEVMLTHFVTTVHSQECKSSELCNISNVQKEILKIVNSVMYTPCILTSTIDTSTNTTTVLLLLQLQLKTPNISLRQAKL